MLRLYIFLLLSCVVIKIDAQTYVYSNADDGFVNIRALPSANSNIVSVLYNGKEGAFLLDSNNKYWYRVNKGGVIGYANKRYVKLLDNLGTSTPKTIQHKAKTATVKDKFDRLNPGMTMQQCLDICGNPNDISTRRSYGGENQSWFYYEQRNGKKSHNSLHFKDGILTAIHTY